jgi:hypothetical protein
VLAQVQATLPSLMNESGPLLADVTQRPDELDRTLSGLTQFASAVAAQEQGGPFLSLNVGLPVANISAGVNAALGYDNPASVDAALGPAANPPTYTAANCPQYPGITNPYCGRGGSPAAAAGQPSSVSAADVGLSPRSNASTGSAQQNAASTEAGSSLAADSYPYADELQAIESVASALNGGRPPASPGVAVILLYPLFASLSGAP